jgi:hypothetical protein
MQDQPNPGGRPTEPLESKQEILDRRFQLMQLAYGD